MKKLIVDAEDVINSKVILYTRKKDGKINIFHPKTTADQVFMSDGVNIEDKLIGISADTYQAAQTAVEAFQKANQAFNSIPDLSGYATIASVNNALATKAGTAIVTTTAAGLCPKLGGGVTNFLRADGTWATPPDTNTTYAVATTSAAGLCPKLGGGTTNFLRADGSWATPPDTNTTYSVATQSVAGLMSAADKKKLDGIATGAQVNPSLAAYATTASVNAALAGYLPLSGGTVTGELYLSCVTPTLFMELPNDNLKGTPDVDTATAQIRIRDKAHSSMAYITYQHTKTGERKFILQLAADGTGGWRNIEFTTKSDGYTTVTIPTHPYLSETSTALVDAYWVNSKLGTGASVASLINLTDTDISNPSVEQILENKKRDAIAQINTEVQQAIYGGFPYEINGTTYHIGYSLFDQNNLNANAVQATYNPEEIVSFRCTDESGEVVWIDLPSETITDIHRFGIFSFRDMIRKEADEKKSRILNCTSIKQIEDILKE